MILTKKQEANLLKTYKSYWDGYVSGDVKNMAKLLDDNYTQVGSAEAEVFSNKKDAVKFLHDTIDQVAGKAEIRNRSIKIEILDDYILVNDLFDIYVLTDGEFVYYAKLRASTLMAEDKGKWKFIHQHSSVPDIRTEDGENIATDKIAAENIQLRDAIKRRTVELESKNRELEIEAALERVRSRTMAMQKTADLLKVGEVLYKEIAKLGVVNLTSGYVLMDEDEKIGWNYNSDPADGTILEEPVGIPHTETPVMRAITKSWKNKEPYHLIELDPQKTIAHQTFVAERSINFPHTAEELISFSPERLILQTFNFKEGYLLLVGGEKINDSQVEMMIRFTKVFEQTYTRFLDLQKAEEQAREAQIEAALERVRSKSMAMHKSEDIGETVATLFDELLKVGIHKSSRSGIGILNETKSMKLWSARSNSADEVDILTGNLDMTINSLLKKITNAWRKQEEHFYYELEGKELLDYYGSINQSKGYALRTDLNTLPEKEFIHVFTYKHGIIYSLNSVPISAEAKQVFIRFAKVFEQTYTRFLDLQKAEEQAREAQIETALERVRSRTMAMQKGEEIKDIVVLLYKELMALGVTNFVTCGYVEINEEINRQYTWVTSPGGDSLGLFYLPLTGDATFDERYAAWKQQQIIFHQKVAGKARSKHLEFAITTFNSKEAEEMVLSQFPDPCVFYCFNFSHGYLHLVTGSKLKNEEELLLARFTRVFEQTYARFLDLQKAEEQAREAQIEAGLERVRSRTLAMHSSDELAETAVVLFKQLMELGIEPNRLFIAIIQEDNGEMEFWITDEDGSKVRDKYSGRSRDNRTFQKMFKGWQQQKKSLIIDLHGKELKDYFKYLGTLNVPFKKGREQKRRVQNMAYFSQGFIGMAAPEPQPDATIELLERFAAVFNLTYTRFNDLQIAETQAREVQIELALERIRAQAMAMKVSSDLLDIVVKMRTEFVALGHEAQYFWYMRWLPEKYEKAMTAGDGNRVGMVMELPRHIHGDIKLLADWEKSKNPTVVFPMDVETAVEYVAKMVELGDFKQVDPNAPSADDIRHIGGITFIMARTTYGEIGYSLPGVVPNPPPEDLNTLKRFAGAFDLAYGRFEDLQKAEAQAMRAEKDLVEIRIARKKAEDALTELQATQSQLVHAEKMASLGELTAGIAHEIQNPLNFVNNFSEVSGELVDEMSDEIDEGNWEDVKEITTDLKQNLEKINHHGQRASSIVKGMLEHSRTGDGTKELTDINKLADEYLRLSYHGLRAKDKSFNADFKLDLDEALPKIKVVPQDIGRVLLNLINNAFQACNERSRSASASLSTRSIKDYKPLVTVSTTAYKPPSGLPDRNEKKAGNLGVEIKVKDNGSGIPEGIKDKIFEPFFTTKPTGQGTGLGLSMSYDIITKGHGGELKVESESGKGSEFIIQIPIKK